MPKDAATPPDHRLSDRQLLFYALAGAAVVANGYYVHPIIGLVAKDFGVDAATIGLAPALNQIALATGILFLLPLGDRISNRRLVGASVAVQLVAVVLMALAPTIGLFLAGSTLLGLATLTPYLLPAYVSKRVDPTRLGRTTAMLASGVVGGVLAGRTSAGFIAEHFGWRTVYVMAAVLLAAVSVGLMRTMEKRDEAAARSSESYGALLKSLWPIVRAHPDAALSGLIQALSFGVFLAVWLGLGLYLTSPKMGYGADTVSWMALASGLNILTTPRLGRLVDRFGAKRARIGFVSVQFTAIVLLALAGDHLWWMIVPTMMMGMVGPPSDVSGRMTILDRAPEIRTRLMTIYVVVMFAGAGLASWLSTAAFEFGGWRADLVTALTLSGTALLLSIASLAVRRKD